MSPLLAGRHLPAGRDQRVACASTPFRGAPPGTVFALWRADEQEASAEVRQLVSARDDLRPLYLNSQGFRVGKSGEVIQVKDGDTLKQEVRLGEVSQINLFGNVQLSTQAIQSFCCGGGSGLLLLAGRLVLWHHQRTECAQRVSAPAAVRICRA